MIKLLIRCLFFIVGIALLLEIALPTRTEQVQVDQHTSQTQTDYRPTSGGDSRWADTSYKIHLIGGRLSSCSVGYSTYSKLKDGDAIEVQSTKLFRICTRITRSEEVIDSYGHWKLIALICGCLLIAAAIGWLKTDEDNGFTFRLG